ncbi:disease resistance protein RUN1-like [Eucalyptus grandis]|uniref:disease resistance protein RUN1-like n=1 Tax=Eucalyptus grandis TaxID=71139 RepID=UPI00192ECF86|nr:disease resistance protein RUN1-like [Eucalyptus grandis]
MAWIRSSCSSDNSPARVANGFFLGGQRINGNREGIGSEFDKDDISFEERENPVDPAVVEEVVSRDRFDFGIKAIRLGFRDVDHGLLFEIRPQLVDRSMRMKEGEMDTARYTSTFGIQRGEETAVMAARASLSSFSKRDLELATMVFGASSSSQPGILELRRAQGYEVFLSFRGPDTRRDFADFLRTMLTDAGIRVFWDEKELEGGKEIDRQLIQAIKQSEVSIPVISREYASSRSCRMELEQMVECMDKKNRIIIPIFYYVDPSDVRHCRDPFEGASDELNNRDRDGVLFNSWNSHGEVIKQIVREVEQKLKKRDLIVPKQLVGVDPHVQRIMAKLKVVYCNGEAGKIGNTREKVLIHGIPGVGKTELAKCVYNKLNLLFDACSFLENLQKEIRDHGIVSVQNRLISHVHKGVARKFDCSDHALKHIQERFRPTNVLLLLDDVKDHEQLSALVGELDWMSQGSRVIVTSQRDDVLKKHKGAEKFCLRTMQQDKALQLFSRHAFERDSPPEKFEELSTNIVAATDGLPLGLKKVGEFLCGKSINVWMEKLIQLKEAPDKSVREAFLESYTTLEENEQQIFLDIACFFNGKDKRIPYYMWRDLQFSPSISILSLCAMSLVEIGEDKKLHTRAILKTFGREIVRSENKKEPCQRSRLWNHEEALDVLIGRKGTEHVEALRLEFGDGYKGKIRFECNQFDGLQNLRFLKLDRADIRGNFGNHFFWRLRWLDWQGCPEIFEDHLNLNLQNLVILDLSGSLVHGNWSGWELLAEARKLKVLNLTDCVHLIATPKFSASMELERLILEGCSNLAVIDPSLGNLEELVSLNMKGCSLLRQLPDLGPMRGLKELVIDGTSISQINVQEGSMKILKFLSARNCKNLTEVSDSIKYLESLKYLSLDSSKIDALPESIGSLAELKTLSLKNCRGLTNLPDGIGRLSSLQLLDLSNTAIMKLPTSVKDLKATKVLNGTFIQNYPETTLNSENLVEINVSLRQELEGEIHFDLERLSSLAITNQR